MWPFVGLSRPSRSLTVVDLPEPFGPSRPKTSPRRTSKSTLSTARAFGRPQKSLTILVRPRTDTMVSAGTAAGAGLLDTGSSEIIRLDQAAILGVSSVRLGG